MEHLYQSYAWIMRHLGFDTSIAHFIQSLEFQTDQPTQILDMGCGTGSIGLTLANRCPQAHVTLCDINPQLLTQAQHNALSKGVSPAQLTFGLGNINHPTYIHVAGATHTFAPASFDMLTLGAVLCYADDPIAALTQLADLIKPNGYLINIEMNQSWVGRWVSKRYHYPLLPTDTLLDTLHACQFEVTTQKVNTFPASLTRTAFIARKHQ